MSTENWVIRVDTENRITRLETRLDNLVKQLNEDKIEHHSEQLRMDKKLDDIGESIQKIAINVNNQKSFFAGITFTITAVFSVFEFFYKR